MISLNLLSWRGMTLSKIAKNLTDLIGNTPLLELTNFTRKHHVEAQIIAKLEFFNPAGSVKDRIGFAMIKDAEERGLINQDSVNPVLFPITLMEQ
jgi:cysteine synthase A